MSADRPGADRPSTDRPSAQQKFFGRPGAGEPGATPDPRTSRARLVLCGVALALAPLLLAAAMLTEVNTSDTAARAFDQIAADRNRFLIGNLLFALGAAALVPGALALAQLARARGAAWMTTGASMVALGGGSMAIGIWTYTAVGYLGTDKGMSKDAMVRLLDRGSNSPVTGLAWIIGTGALLGLIVCAIGLLRAHTVPRWEAALLIVAPICTFFGNGGVVGALLTLPLVVALLALAYEVLTMQSRRAGVVDVTDGARRSTDAGVAAMPSPRADYDVRTSRPTSAGS